MSWATDWSADAACRGADPDELFVQGAAQNRAKAVCTGCPVRTECLADALDNRVEFGVWGGMTERERRAFCPSTTKSTSASLPSDSGRPAGRCATTSHRITTSSHPPLVTGLFSHLR